MQVDQTNHTSNVIPFTKIAGHDRDQADNPPRDNIIRMLDLAKFEQPRPSIHCDASMRANIAAMVLLGLLVFLGKDFSHKFERSNLCPTKSECIY